MRGSGQPCTMPVRSGVTLPLRPPRPIAPDEIRIIFFGIASSSNPAKGRVNVRGHQPYGWYPGSISRLRSIATKRVNELVESLLARMAPSDAERMASRIGIHTVPVFGLRVHCIL